MGIKRYTKLFFINMRQYLIYSLTYPVSFLIELLVELGYNAAFLLFYVVIYQHTNLVGGWTYYQMLFFLGLNIVVSELLVGLIFGDKIWHLPEYIKNGTVDFWLLKPVHPLFSALMPPYTTSLIAGIPGLYIMAVTFQKIASNPVSIIAAVGVFICGLIIIMCLAIILSLFSFIFVGASTLPRIVSQLIFEYKAYPHSIYKGVFKTVFFFIVPVVYVASVPSQFLFSGVTWWHLFFALFLAIFLWKLMFITWDKMITFYSSASS